ncbi:hypothetical protein T261_5369 [Streptomyces lydicus]|nr:hypothetical protein T261_5369 [Streptomyces lydicus]
MHTADEDRADLRPGTLGARGVLRARGAPLWCLRPGDIPARARRLASVVLCLKPHAEHHQQSFRRAHPVTAARVRRRDGPPAAAAECGPPGAVDGGAVRIPPEP